MSVSTRWTPLDESQDEWMTKCSNIDPMADSSVSKAANVLPCDVAWYSCICEVFACQLQHASSNLSRPEDSIGCRSVYLALRSILLLLHGLQDLPAHERGFVHALAALRLFEPLGCLPVDSHRP